MRPPTAALIRAADVSPGCVLIMAVLFAMCRLKSRAPSFHQAGSRSPKARFAFESPMGRPQVVEMLVHGYRTTERFFPRCGRNGFTNLAAAVVPQPKQAKPWNELPGFLGELGARAIRTNSNHRALSKRPTTKVAVTTSSITTFSLLTCTCLVKCSFTR